MLVELRFEDCDDAFAMGRTDGQRPATGGLQAIFTVGFAQIQQPQAGSVTLLRMRPVF